MSGLADEIRLEDEAIRNLHGKAGRSVAWVVIVARAC